MTHMTEEDFQQACADIGNKFMHLSDEALEHLAGACLFKRHGGLTTLNFKSGHCPLCDGEGCSWSLRRRSMLLIEVNKLVGKSHTINFRPNRECSKHSTVGAFPPSIGEFARLAIMSLDDDGAEQSKLVKRRHRPCALCKRNSIRIAAVSNPRPSAAVESVSHEELDTHLRAIESDVERRAGHQLAVHKHEIEEESKSLVNKIVEQTRQIARLQEAVVERSGRIQKLGEKVARRDARIVRLKDELQSALTSAREDERSKVRDLKSKLTAMTDAHSRLNVRHSIIKRQMAKDRETRSSDIKTARKEGVEEGLRRVGKRHQTLTQNNHALRESVKAYERREEALKKAIESLRSELHARRSIDPHSERGSDIHIDGEQINDDIVRCGVDIVLDNIPLPAKN